MSDLDDLFANLAEDAKNFTQKKKKATVHKLKKAPAKPRPKPKPMLLSSMWQDVAYAIIVLRYKCACGCVHDAPNGETMVLRQHVRKPDAKVYAKVSAMVKDLPREICYIEREVKQCQECFLKEGADGQKSVG